MEDNNETGKYVQDAIDDNMKNSEAKGESLTSSVLADKQNSCDKMELHVEGPKDSPEQSLEETVQLQTLVPDDEDDHKKIVSEGKELHLEDLDLIKEEKTVTMISGISDDKEKEILNDGLKLEDADEKNKSKETPTEDVELRDVDLSSSPQVEDEGPGEYVELPPEKPSASTKEEEEGSIKYLKFPSDVQGQDRTDAIENVRGLDRTDAVENAAVITVGMEANGVCGDPETVVNDIDSLKQPEHVLPHEGKSLGDETEEEPNNGISQMDLCLDKETASDPEVDEVNDEDLELDMEEMKEAALIPEKDVVKDQESNFDLDGQHIGDMKSSNKSFLLDSYGEGDESGTEEEQVAFMKELETFFKERSLDFKPPKFYGEGLNLLKLWRSVIRLGGYDQVTSCKLWRQVGESFKPPKTCTTVSWTFRCFYEKALLEYEKHKMNGGELPLHDVSSTEPGSVGSQAGGSQGSGGRARRDAAARAMQGWHSQRLLGNGEVGDPIIKDKISSSTPRREKQLKSIGILKRRTPSPVERDVKVARLNVAKPQLDMTVVDVGDPADWVKINVRRTKDCFEVYALVPGLLREEVRVQSDPAGRLVISGEPEHLDNPWGVTPFKKVVSLPSRIDPHQTSAVVTLHGQLFVRVPFEQSDS